MLCLNQAMPTFQNMESWRISAFSQQTPILKFQGSRRTRKRTTQTTITNGLAIKCLNSLQTKTELMHLVNVYVIVSTKSYPTLTRWNQEELTNADFSKWITASLPVMPPNRKLASAQLLKVLNRMISPQGPRAPFGVEGILARLTHKKVTMDLIRENKTSWV